MAHIERNAMLENKAQLIYSKLNTWMQIIFANIKDVGNFDEYLNERDKKPFDQDWIEAFNKIESMKKLLEEDDKEKIEELNKMIRENAFKLSMRFNDSELAAYVSDDFGLIYDCLVLRNPESDIDWVYGILNSYINGNFPKGSIHQQRLMSNFI